MASRLNEDEKNERIIRGLIKLQHNRRCINCNSLFPSMSSLQGALPSVAPSVSMHLSGLSYPSNAWTLPPSSYVSVLPAQAQTHASAFGPRAYVGQQMPANMGQHIPANIPIPRQEVGSFGVGGAAIGLSNPDQQLTRSSSTNPNPHPFPGGGNPFG
ncbi:hypothetical protein Lalb_Chr22g0352941 [Lupinus albus]|uniref:Uncharacterized protein n=1 Tax=Lupinus albus TaxID=3870 RepID=A0A6A4NNH7_LUPAL|nr:hypothetical protein Lalb_Chr22g0352941 [Lupinus albus]